MMCPKCGKVFDGDIVRCPECGTEFDAQYAPPNLESGPTLLTQTRQTVIPKNVPLAKAKRSKGWVIAVAALAAIVLGAVLFVILTGGNPVN